MRVPRGHGKGTWHQSADGSSTHFECPNCGKLMHLNDHKHDGNGNVSPSVRCPTGCGFHDHLFLEGISP